MSHGIEVTAEPLDDETRATVLALAAAATAHDGVAPLSVVSLLRVRHDSPTASHLVARADGGAVVGYLLLVPGGEPTDLVAELAVDPVLGGADGANGANGADSAGADGDAVARALLTAAVDEAHVRPDVTTLRVWSHGDAPGSAALAAELGFDRDRILLQMGRPTSLLLPDVQVPDGVRLRTYRPGADDEAWVALNARAFAGHPEQAYVTLDDLRERQAEAWFDPAGFFVAERVEDGRLVGFHWTKVHRDEPEPVGEVYVVGVDPSAQGTGLGLTLTATGLAHLAGLGIGLVILYADESNTGAVAMYERLGFTTRRTDVEHAYRLR